MFVVIPLSIIIKEKVTFIFLRQCQKLPKNMIHVVKITPSCHVVLVRICGRKVEVTEHSLMIIQQLIFKLYGYWVFVIYVIKK